MESGESLTARSQRIREFARNLGFDPVGIAPAVSPETLGQFGGWCDAGYAGEMRYIERRRNAYEHPDSLLQGVRSILMVGLNYSAAEPAPLSPNTGRVSRYAVGTRDYHDVLRERLRSMADKLHSEAPGCRTRAIVDTAPLLERDFARLAGLGWFGKNTMLINKQRGSWFFLGAVLTDIELSPDAPHATSHCGTCTRCLTACPTDAFVAPYVLDARKCISYLTIELRDREIPAELREGVGEWLFGCDICQDVCPWNRKAPLSVEPDFRPRGDLDPVDCIALLQITEDEFNERFGTTPLARPGRGGLVRNACIVLGNRGDARSHEALERATHNEDPIVRDAAMWALQRLAERGVLESADVVAHNQLK
jgi:epoxyqueuosine reductase